MRMCHSICRCRYADYVPSDPVLEDHFWMNPFAKHFSAMKASDLVLVDGEGYVTDGGAQAPINEAGFMIHSEIHKARPDVVAAAHTHGIYGKTWSAFGRPVEMLSQGISQLSFSGHCILTAGRRVQLLRETGRLRQPRRRCAGAGGGPADCAGSWCRQHWLHSTESRVSGQIWASGFSLTWSIAS